MRENPYLAREESGAKKFDKYASERRGRMSPAEREVAAVLDRVYGWAMHLQNARRARGLTQEELAELSALDSGFRLVHRPTATRVIVRKTACRPPVRIEH